MRKKIFTFLCAALMSVGMFAEATVTWDQAFCEGVKAYKSSSSGSILNESNTKGGITVTFSGSVTMDGLESGGIWLGDGSKLTFSSEVGDILNIEVYYIFKNAYRQGYPAGWTDDTTNKKFVWNGTAASVDMVKGSEDIGISVDHIVFTIDGEPAPDPNPSTPAGLQVTELQVPGSWQDNPTMLSTSDMPGFVAITEAEATAWDAAPAGDVALIFAFEGNGATALVFKNGVYQAAQAHNITYEDLYAWYSEGDKIFYTGGGSTPSGDEGKLPGAFSINSDGDYIAFSKGNLQYQASTTTWQFAANQYDIVGSDNSNISDSYAGWIDLFGYGTGNNPTLASTSYSAFSTFTDWGVNAISNGGNEANLWRTLTRDEWAYLFNSRTNASSKYGMATVANVPGVIVLPDVYAGSAINTDHDGWGNNIISSGDWAAYETAGAVFLPVAGYREGTTVDNLGSYGFYWSSTPNDAMFSKKLSLDQYLVEPEGFGLRYQGLSVRLVQATSAPSSGSEPEPTEDAIVIVTKTKQSSYTQGTVTISCAAIGDSDGFTVSIYGDKTATITNSDASKIISKIELVPGYSESYHSYVRANGGTPASSSESLITFTNVNSNDVTLSITNEYIQIKEVRITLADNGGSTPAVDPTPTPSATSGIFAYNYDCSRTPAYPSKNNSCVLSGFSAPCVGLNGIGVYLNPKNVTQGPWKVEFYEMYDDDHVSTYGEYEGGVRNSAYGILLEYYGWSVVPDYYDDPSAFAAYAHEKLPIYKLSQWNGNAYQVVGYGFICAYAGEGNVVEHAALFIEAGNDYGCFLSGHEHSGSLGLTFDYDLKDDMTSFFTDGGGSTPANPEIKMSGNFSGSWADTEAFTDNGDGTATLLIELEVEHYNFGMKVDGVWTSDSHEFTDANPSYVVTGSSDVMWFEADVAGEYSFTWEYATNTLTLGWPTVAPTPANPSGECGAQGDNLLWELNTSTGVLTITGSGAMADWHDDTQRPWYAIITQITSVVLPNGITSIGEKAFRGCTNLASINMAENYPASLTTIKQEAFCHTALTSVTIPESVVTIGQDAFYLSQGITDVYCYADPNNLTWNDYYKDDFNKSPAKSTQCHVKNCHLDVFNTNWNTGNSTDVNVTFVGDLPGECGGSTPAVDQAVQDVIALINAIPNPVAYNDECKDAIDAARAAYDALNADQKALVSNYSTLTDAEDAYAALIPVVTNYSISLDGITENADKVTLNKASAAEGETITLTPAAGYQITAFTASYASAYSVRVTADPNVDVYEATPYVGALPKEFTENVTPGLNGATFYSIEGDDPFTPVPASVLEYVGMNAAKDQMTIRVNDAFSGIIRVYYTYNVETCEWDDYSQQEICMGGTAQASVRVVCEAAGGVAPASKDAVTGAYSFTMPAGNVTITATVEAIPEPETHDVVTNEDPENPGVYYYSTFFHSSQNYALTNDGTTAFVADLSGDDLVLTKIAEGEQVIPANTAVILRKTGSNEPVVLAPTDEEGVTFTANNDLQGVDEPTTLESLSIDPLKCYVLSGTAELGVGFYLISGNTLKAHKAYVIYTPVPNQGNAPRRMRFVFENEQTATGIEQITNDPSSITNKVMIDGVLYIIKNGVRYNAQGQVVK